ncbi:hypothetical protein IGI04_022904 [Brassica rapa subsp. trilocularis]|uniref:FAS1 domain-containing protein n=1 Tax=Brassica rapa subsp. trilocularis TaxID=1813537 RepID=A0ABQ7M299_BRACM|nr:hypothetical protein IGI04_022904 [Brassica rapa subsp. trilocularis]
MATSIHLLLFFLATTVSFLTSAAYPPSQTPRDQSHILLKIYHVKYIFELASGFRKPSYGTAQDHLHADRIIEAMIGAGDFRDWASDFLFAVEDQVGIPLSATIFIPIDFDTADISSTNAVVVSYHIVPQRLSFTDLRFLKPLSLAVTNNSVSGFTLDGVLVTEPDFSSLLRLLFTVSLRLLISPFTFDALPITIMFGMCSIFVFVASILQRRLMVISENPKGEERSPMKEQDSEVDPLTL